MIDIYEIISIILWLPLIALFDYLVFGKLLGSAVYYKENGKVERMAKWWWVVPSFLEIMCFMAGVAVGMLAIK